MLYDKRWEKPEVKADPFSLESLIAWLEKMPADGKYDWSEPTVCLFGQWCSSNNVPEDDIREKSLELGKPCNWVLFDIAFGDLENGCTFGAALERARKAVRH